MKRIRLHLTGIGEELTEAAEKKLEQETDETPTCDAGRNREWYDDMAIPIPQELKDKEKIFNQGVKLEDEDFEEYETEVLVYEDQIKLMVESEGLTTIFLKDGLTIVVLESVEAIDGYIDYLNMNWFERNYLLFLNFFRQKFNIKN